MSTPGQMRLVRRYALTLVSAEARDATLSLVGEVGRAREYAERIARSGNRAYAKAGRELLAILDGGEG